MVQRNSTDVRIPLSVFWNKSAVVTDFCTRFEFFSHLPENQYELSIPYDGAVMAYDDVEYGMSLGRTDKFFRHSIAYKYEQELHETVLEDIEWQTSKTGLINPVAIFKETIIDGASVTRATLHNVSYIANLQLGIGDKIRVYKANQIIPKVHDNLTRSNTWKLPDKCPNCGGTVELHNDNGSMTLCCINSNCSAKLLGQLNHFVSKNAINIAGLSEQTLQKFIELGWLKSFQDIMNLKDHPYEMTKLDGFGKRSVDKLLDAIEKSRNTTLDRFIYSLSIPFVGRSASKEIAKLFSNDYDKFIENCLTTNFTKIDGFGNRINDSLHNYISANKNIIIDLASEFTFENEKSSTVNIAGTDLSGKVFVITGSLVNYKNRNELVEVIEGLGGKVSGSVSAKTSYLINNDKESASSKNKKAKQLGIAIISEEDFISMIN